ncbi:Mu transposase C-terminal domain-containing protein [Sneathiella sp.]|uniref:Mu transposase C-terminal domain-containing protein n=1 Tax=Sneathiella sp. TaxID=1964365 RepID=UPI002FE046C4
MIAAWYTAAEIADLNIPGLPTTRQGVMRLVEVEQWQAERTRCRPRAGQGGGVEYHISLLPAAAQSLLALRSLKAGMSPVPLPEAPPVTTELPRRACVKRDAKMAVLALYDAYAAESRDTVEMTRYAFTILYNDRNIPAVQKWVYEAIKRVSISSLKNWLRLRDAGKISALGGQYGNRRGTSLFDTAFDGAVAKFIAAHIIHQPHLTAAHIRDLLRDEFGEMWSVGDDLRSIPNIRSLQRWMGQWKKENAEILMKITDPDRWKNKYLAAPGTANAWVNAPNQLWEIDASPADALCLDGRQNIYCVIDVYTRRMKVLVSRTPATVSSLLLIRQAIMDWGVPEIIRTDNGSDFTSHAFVRALTSLGIRQDVAAPFTPEHKGTVERAIGTLQRGCMPLLPGFIGHNVTDRKAIEARRAFAQRLGEKDAKAFTIELTADQLQDRINQWVENKYHHNPHKGLSGDTPWAKYNAWHGSVKRIENEDILHILLAEVPGVSGIRTVGKKGVSVENNFYWSNLLQVGQKVHVRFDPTDLGRIYCFTEDQSEFICAATNAELMGIDPIAAAATAKAAQKDFIRRGTAELRKEASKIKPASVADAVLRQAERDAEAAMEGAKLLAFPKAPAVHNTAFTEAAADALFSRTPDLPSGPANEAERYEEALIRQEKLARNRASISVVDEANSRYVKAKNLQKRIAAGADVDAADESWLLRYIDSAEYRTRRKMEEDFGENFFQG